MKIQIINQTKSKIPQKALLKLCKKLMIHFKKNKLLLRAMGLGQGEDFDDLLLVFVSKSTSQKLNFQYRKKNKPTDVLSFSPQEPQQGLGELVLCVDVLKTQALEMKHSLKKEMETMIVHGFLHLLGYDHEKSLKEHKRMMRMQTQLLEKYSD